MRPEQERAAARRAIARVRDILGERGWCKEDSGTDYPEGEHCIMGALDLLAAGEGRRLAGRTFSWLAHELGYAAPYCPVAFFNDATDTEYEDVLAFLDLAAEVLL